MPKDFLTTDLSFPDLNGKGTEEKFQTITGYLYSLLEQLRYTLSNLGEDNFNSADLGALGQTLTEPLRLQIQDTEGNVAELWLRADQLETSVRNAQEDYSEVKQTVDGMEVTIGQQGNKLTAIAATIEGLKIQTVEGVSALSGVALYFYDPRYPNTIIGKAEIDDKGRGTAEESKYRMFVGTKTSQSGEEYSLKLESAGASSYESRREIYITAGKDEKTGNYTGNYAVSIDGGGRINTCNENMYGDLTLYPAAGGRVAINDGKANNSGWYEFRGDGLYHEGAKIGFSREVIRGWINELAAKNDLKTI